MIINDLNLKEVILPFDGKAYAILIIYSNAVLSLPVSMQGF